MASLSAEIRLRQNQVTAASAELDAAVDDMISALMPRLRRANGYNLKRLKRALRNFNIHTGGWSES